MLRVLDTVEKNVTDSPKKPMVIADSVALEVIPDTTGIADEFAYIELFNAGDNPIYYAYGRQCDNVNNFNAFIMPNGMLEVKTRQSVSVFSVGGSIVSFTLLKRNQAIGNYQ